MAKLTLTNLGNGINTLTSQTAVNDNNDLIEAAIENTLSRDGTSPNSMNADLDMNSYFITNVPTPTSDAHAVNKAYADGLVTGTSLVGDDGDDGDDGWTPVLAVVSDGDRRVQQIVGYVGGTGTSPTTYLNYYLTDTTPVSDISLATDVRGAQGTSGAGTGDLLASNNLSDLSSISTARTNLGLVIGTNVQAYDSELAALAGLTSAADKVPYFTGSGTAALADLTSYGRSLIAVASEAALKALVNLEIGTDVQAYDADTAKLDVEDQIITGGASVTSLPLGTISSGTVTPDPGDRPMQHYTNNGAHTLAPGSVVGSYLLDITNGASAGAVTTSGWTKVVGSFATTNAYKYRCHCSIGNGGSLLSIQAMQ